MVYQRISAGIGAIGSAKMKFFHPSAPMRERYPNVFMCDRLGSVTLTGEDFRPLLSSGRGGPKKFTHAHMMNFPASSLQLCYLSFGLKIHALTQATSLKVSANPESYLSYLCMIQKMII